MPIRLVQHPGCGVSKKVCYPLKRNATIGEQRCRCMTEFVRRDRWKLSLLADSSKCTPTIPRIPRPTHDVREDQVQFVPGSVSEPHLGESGSLLTQKVVHWGCDGECAECGFCLQIFDEHGAVALRAYCSTNGDRAVFEVHGVPTEAGSFTRAHSGHELQPEQRTEPFVPSAFQSTLAWSAVNARRRCVRGASGVRSAMRAGFDVISFLRIAWSSTCAQR